MWPHHLTRGALTVNYRRGERRGGGSVEGGCQGKWRICDPTEKRLWPGIRFGVECFQTRAIGDGIGVVTKSTTDRCVNTLTTSVNTAGAKSVNRKVRFEPDKWTVRLFHSKASWKNQKAKCYTCEWSKCQFTPSKSINEVNAKESCDKVNHCSNRCHPNSFIFIANTGHLNNSSCIIHNSIYAS